MPAIPNLRSPYDTVGGIVYFGRLIDKIRLHAEGKLPPDYVANLGHVTGTFDARCLDFLGIKYDELKAYVLDNPGLSDEAILEWAFQHGRKPTPEEIEIWNGFMMKRGWRDSARERLRFRLQEAGLPDDGRIATMFDFIDVDEGRPLKTWD